MTEGDIQRAVFDNLRKRAVPGAVFWHVPNGPEARCKAGYLAGVSDINILHRGDFYAMELKKDGGRPSEDQLKFLSKINTAGGYGCVAEGLDQALQILEAWGVMRKDAV